MARFLRTWTVLVIFYLFSTNAVAENSCWKKWKIKIKLYVLIFQCFVDECLKRKLSNIKTAKQLIKFYTTEKFTRIKCENDSKSPASYHSHRLNNKQWRAFSKVFKQQVNLLKTLPPQKWTKKIKSIVVMIEKTFIYL